MFIHIFKSLTLQNKAVMWANLYVPNNTNPYLLMKLCLVQPDTLHSERTNSVQFNRDLIEI